MRAPGLLPVVLVALAGCAAHEGAPGRAPFPGAEYETTVERGLVYTPAGWPERLAADLHLPRGLGPFPAVVAVHGGGWERGEREDMEDIARQLARRGFATLNISYRLAPEYRFPAQLHDLQQAVRWLRANAALYRVDAERIAAFGYSSGGQLAALLGTIDEGSELDRPYGGPDARLKAVVAGATPFDFNRYQDSPLISQYLGVSRREDPALHTRASPISHVSGGDPPMFIYHGGWDRLVPLEHAQAMKEALDAAGVESELYVVGGLGHVTLFLLSGDAVEKAVGFLDRHLRGR